MSNDHHILSAFDRDLEAIQALLMRMGGLVEEAIREGARSLETRDVELAEIVRQNDKAIDELEERINHDVARVLALRAPAATDLRTVLTVLKISGNLERMGDYAKNMAKRTAILAELPAIDGAAGALRRMAVAVAGLLNDALDAYIHRNADLALAVRNRDQDVDQMYNTLFRDLLTHMMENPRMITASMHLHFIAKNVERMGDHATSIAEQVIYLVTGKLPDESRPKSDVISTLKPGAGA
jgi:phosphate transport system protein